MRYEVTLCPGLTSCEVNADSEIEARREFMQALRDQLDIDHFEATALDKEGEASKTKQGV